MHPQSELENYKLQVELLQEKLNRSEDNRQDLEAKLEQILKKRSEHERTLRSRTQKKYQQFLDEQKKRNERNRKLIEMLERIDQQAAELSARSERLKNMKIQYELYFSKLVQSYSLKALQTISAVPIIANQAQPSSYTSIKNENSIPTETYQSSFNNNTSQFQTVPVPVLVPIPNEPNRFHRSWGFPTVPPGVLITLPNSQTLLSGSSIGDGTRNELSFGFDYAQFPIGYIPRPETSSHIQYNKKPSYPQEPHQQIQSMPVLTPEPSSVDNSELSRSQFKYASQNPSLLSNLDDRTNDTLLNGAHSESGQPFSKLYNDNPKRADNSRISENPGRTEEFVKNDKYQIAEVSSDDSSVPRQGLKVDKLPKIKPNNYFQPETANGRVVRSRGNEFNAIDFRTDDNIKYTKEIKYGDEENIVRVPSSAAPQEQSIDNITTTLQIQKIDETNVKDDEKINDVEDNEKNTSLAFPPLDGKCSMESIGDEALTRNPSEKKTKENTSYVAARNIDPSRDTEQITLFNGTKNSIDEGTGASNRTSVVIDDGGENIENAENKYLETTSYRPKHFARKEKMSIDNIETAIYGELLTKSNDLTSASSLAGNLRSNESEQSVNQIPDKVDNYECEDTSNRSVQQEAEVEQAKLNESIEEYSEVKEGDQNYNADPSDAQMYTEQNYNYSETAPTDDFQQHQQPFTYSEDQEQLRGENYTTDYQNYDPSQYQETYDPNAYQYDYEQQQYIDPNQGQYTDPNQEQYADPSQEQYIDPNLQGQYTAESYGQEYQQTPYEYAKYDQNAIDESNLPNQRYTEVQSSQVVSATEHEQGQTYSENQFTTDTLEPNAESIPSKQESIELNEDSLKPKSLNINESNEEISAAHKPATPASILATEKHSEAAATTRKKKRVNFVDSETDESSNQLKADTLSSESDFDFSTSN